MKRLPNITKDNIEEYFCFVEPEVGDKIIVEEKCLVSRAIRKARNHGFSAYRVVQAQRDASKIGILERL